MQIPGPNATAASPPSIDRRSWVSVSFLLTIAFLPCLVTYLFWTYDDTSFRRGHPPPSILCTSVWCRGSNRSDRHCRFKNLCYRRASDEFLFVHGPDSVVSGVDVRGSGYLADMTSVENLNIHYFSLTDVPAGALRDAEIRFFEGDTVFLKRFKPDNIMHVLHDDVLPLYATLRELCMGDDQDCFDKIRVALMDFQPAGPLFSYYALLSDNVLLADGLTDDAIHCFEKAHVGISKETTWYDYGFGRPQHPIGRPASGEAIRSFGNFALSRLGIRREDCPAGPRAVLVSRTQDRLILNELEVAEAVAQTTSWQVVRLEDPGRSDPRRVLESVACAEMLVGMHGAELVLAAFMKPWAVLLELFPYAVPAEEYAPYRSLAAIAGVDLAYASWENFLPANSRGHPDRPARGGGLWDLTSEERRRIMDSQRVAPHVCCDDRQWLYRIYQDTAVDVLSLTTVLREVLERRDRTAGPSEVDDGLYPGPVRDAACSIAGKNRYELTWREPWNLKYLAGEEDVRYEIWTRKVGEEDARAALTRGTRHAIPTDDGAPLDCWIACYVGNKTGIRLWVSCG